MPGYAGFYEVSDEGEVYSLGRPKTRGGLLRVHVNPQGYRFVRLYRYGQIKSVTVARLVLLTFRGPPEHGQRARHGAGGPLDDRLGNLYWG